MSERNYSNNVFINCPFDEQYTDLFRAIVFTVYSCGFMPRCALEQDNALDSRLFKIQQLIRDCKYGIHDISRIELTTEGLPRFNMPFELGLFFGAKHYGEDTQKDKVAIVFEKEKFSYQKYISDLNGIDTKAHGNKPEELIKHLVSWLKTASRRQTIPGAQAITANYRDMLEKLPAILQRLSTHTDSLVFNDLCLVMEEIIAGQLGK